MNAFLDTTRPGLLAAARQALQWRLLLLWLLGLALPLLLMSLPLFIALDSALKQSLLGEQLLTEFNPALLIELVSGLGERGYGMGSGLAGLIVYLLLLPWLSGLLISAARAPQRLGLGALLQGGLGEYGRMARLWLWALLPLGLAGAIGGSLLHLVDKQAEKTILAADVEHLKQAALAVGGLLFLLANASLDAARAQLIVEPRRRSVVRAWWHGCRTLILRPGRIVLYALVTLAGLLVAALLGWLRIQLPPVSGPVFAVDLLLGQMLVLALVWMRCARLFALVNAGRM